MCEGACVLKRPLNGICYSPLLTEILRAFHKAGVSKLSCVYKWGTPSQCEPYKGVFPNYSWDFLLNINLHIQKHWGRKTSEKANLGEIAPAMREKESVLFTPGLLRPWYFLFKLFLQEEKCKKAGAASDRREGGGHMCRSRFMFTLYWGSSVFQSVWLFATPCIAALQACLCITNFQSMLKFMSIELVMLSNHLIFRRSLFWCLSPFSG